MSLTSHLRNTNDPLARFFQSRFPNVRNLISQINAEIRAAKTIDTPGLEPWEYGLIGTAIDYRIRYFFDATPYQEFVAYECASQLGADSLEVLENLIEYNQTFYMIHPDIQRFFDSLEIEVGRIQPVARLPDPIDEQLLARYCLILALFEQIYRSGLWNNSNSPLVQAFNAGKLKSIPDFLNICRENWVDDIKQLATLFYKNSSDQITQPVILNPTFQGSEDVGGADADLIIGDTLIDIKATKLPNFKPHYIYQLLGYVLLDYEGQYNINSIGFYLARQGIWHTWFLSQYLVALGVATPYDLGQIRSDFQDVTSSLL